eukprot:15470960-Alexandrium_andersonii.AAC.1
MVQEHGRVARLLCRRRASPHEGFEFMAFVALGVLVEFGCPQQLGEVLLPHLSERRVAGNPQLRRPCAVGLLPAVPPGAVDAGDVTPVVLLLGPRRQCLGDERLRDRERLPQAIRHHRPFQAERAQGLLQGLFYLRLDRRGRRHRRRCRRHGAALRLVLVEPPQESKQVPGRHPSCSLLVFVHARRLAEVGLPGIHAREAPLPQAQQAHQRVLADGRAVELEGAPAPDTLCPGQVIVQSEVLEIRGQIAQRPVVAIGAAQEGARADSPRAVPATPARPTGEARCVRVLAQALRFVPRPPVEGPQRFEAEIRPR